MNHHFEMPYPQYRCPTCGKDLPLDEARMTVTCAEHARPDRDDIIVRKAAKADAGAVEDICVRATGEIEVDAFDTTFDVLKGVNFIAEVDGEMAGLLSLGFHGGEVAVIILSVYPQFQGLSVGRRLLAAAEQLAAERNFPSMRVAVSNDDISLLYFYQRLGFVISEVAVGAIADRHGSASPGFSGIPVRDEIRLRRSVKQG